MAQKLAKTRPSVKQGRKHIERVYFLSIFLSKLPALERDNPEIRVIYLIFSCSLISLTVILRILKSESKNRAKNERKVVFHSSEFQSMAKNKTL